MRVELPPSPLIPHPLLPHRRHLLRKREREINGIVINKEINTQVTCTCRRDQCWHEGTQCCHQHQRLQQVFDCLQMLWHYSALSSWTFNDGNDRRLTKIKQKPLKVKTISKYWKFFSLKCKASITIKRRSVEIFCSLWLRKKNKNI
mgnify:FL=1